MSQVSASVEAQAAHGLDRKAMLGASGALAILLVGTGVWWWSSGFEDTDNAYTAAHVATLSSKVPGLVSDVLIEENQKVKKGQVLVRIDQRDYHNSLDQLRAQLRETEANLDLARRDFDRAVKLYSQSVVSEQARDTASAKYRQLGSFRDSILAQISQSELNLEYTEIRAPSDGTVGKKAVEPGMVVSAAQPLLSFVDARAPWVTANFKETQLRKVRPGQTVEVEIDSIAGKTFEAEVESITPGTGATFALIPPENATGNFTKIVQRVPVRIRFLPESIRGFEDRIVPGLSVEAKVYLK